MKELSIEEKAKRYDEVIPQLKGLLDGIHEEKCDIMEEDIIKIFPELAESEDEKIRKWLIALIRSNEYGSISDVGVMPCPKPRVLAWLEKQGEKGTKGNEREIPNSEQNPAFEMKTTEESLNIDSDSYNKIVDECIFGEQNPAWSEEDEYVFNKVLNWVLIVNPTSSIFEKLPKEQFIERFKSIRPQINVTDEELAQAKKEAYNDALDKIEYHSGEPTFDDGWSAAIWYLKKRNAQPQSQWKPSDEQMEALLYEVNAWDEDSVNGQNLKLLYQDLKKLTE